METINTDTFVLNKPLFNGLSQQFIKSNLPPDTSYYYNTNYFILTSYVKPEIEKYLKDVREDRDFVEYFKEVVVERLLGKI